MTETDVRTDPRLSALSEGQLAALSLVAQYKSSKEIARILDISPHTVDQRMKRVQALLGVSSRFEAARMLMDSPFSPGTTPREAWGDLIYRSPDIPERSIAGDGCASAAEEDRVADGVTFHQAPPAYARGFVGWNDHRPWYQVLWEAGRTNDLTPGARTGIIGGLAIMAVLTMALLVSAVEGLSRIF